MTWLNNLKFGLAKTTSKISDGINNIFVKKKLDSEILEELEDLLLSADLGIEVTNQIIQILAKEKFDKEVKPEEVKKLLAEIIANTLIKFIDNQDVANSPKVIFFCGVNGNGKTTSVGKMAYKYINSGKSVVMACCDTFRAAAVEQLKFWAKKNNCHIVEGDPNSDAASVAYKAFDYAIKHNIDYVLIDTAGRLQNKINLMDELSKIIKVIKKLDNTAPHETILVLDSTTGQNAHSQLEKFNEIAKISSLIITKLDGTAKAGVVVSLSNKYKIPIKAIGVGEGIEDLQDFNPTEFANNIVGL